MSSSSLLRYNIQRNLVLFFLQKDTQYKSQKQVIQPQLLWFYPSKRFSFWMRTTSKINSLSKNFFWVLFSIDESRDNFIIYYVFFLGYIFLFSSSYQISTSEANTEFICENSRTDVLQHQFIFGEAQEFC